MIVKPGLANCDDLRVLRQLRDFVEVIVGYTDNILGMVADSGVKVIVFFSELDSLGGGL